MRSFAWTPPPGSGMDISIFAILTQDGIASGAVYGLLALALVLVFSITRVIFIPLGELVAFGALTMAALQAGKTPASAVLLLVLGGATFLHDAAGTLRSATGQAADHAYVLETGELVMEGPASELANDPKVIDTYLGLNKKAA
jgi:hypothetical protein